MTNDASKLDDPAAEPTFGIECRIYGEDGTLSLVGDGFCTIGEATQHMAVSNLPILSVEWQVDMTSIIQTFQATEEVGGPVPFNPAELVVNPLWFTPFKPGPLVVSVQISTTRGTAVVTRTLQVTAPTVTNFAAATGAPEVWQDANQRTMLQFISPFNGPGIVINANVSGTQAASGTLAFIQIAQNARWLTENNQTQHININGQSVVDTGMSGSYIYQNVTVPLATGQAGALISVTDSPGMQLPIPPAGFQAFYIGNEVITREQYQMYLMFCSSAMGSSWAPLGVLNWNWAGYSEAKGNDWTAVQEPEWWPNPPGALTTTYPTWNGNTSDGRFVPGAGVIEDKRSTPPAASKKAAGPAPVLQATYAMQMPIMPGSANWITIGPPDAQGLPLIASALSAVPFQFFSFDPSNPALLKIMGPNGSYVNIRGGFGIGQLYCDCTSFELADQFLLKQSGPSGERSEPDSPGGYFVLVSPDDTYAATINDTSNPLVLFLDDAQQPGEFIAEWMVLTSL